jgi:hypothetical protein
MVPATTKYSVLASTLGTVVRFAIFKTEAKSVI